MITQKCTKCGEVKEIIYFKKDRTKSTGYYSSCKDCNKKDWKNNYANIAEKHRAKNKKYAEENKEKISDYIKKYYIENIEEIKEYGKKYRVESREVYIAGKKTSKANKTARKFNCYGKLKREDVEKCYEKHRGTCEYCGKELGMLYTIDHKIPMSLGGDNTYDNLTIACMDCNMRKGQRTYEKYMEIINGKSDT